MKKFIRVAGSAVTLSLLFGLICFMRPVVVHAATSPSLGDAASYSVLTGTQATNSGNTTVSGNIGTDPAGGGAPTGFPPGIVGPPGTIHTWDTSAHNAQVAQKAVFDNSIDAVSQPCSPGFGAMIPSLDGLTLDPGVYCTAANFTLSGTLTLHGTGSPATDVWIFRNGAASDLIASGSANVVFSGTGGYACNVWWRIGRTATFTTNNVMKGNILAGTSITMANGTSLDGRAFAYTAEVTLINNAISGPICAAVVPPATPGVNNTITVFKQVVNSNGGTATYTDFPLFVSGFPVASGQAVGFSPGTYTVTETSNAKYKTTFAGDCNAQGVIVHGGINTHNSICTIINSDIGPVAPIVAPLIHVTKIPTPLTLPNGPGSVTYNFAVSNVGIVPMTNVTVTDNKCSLVTFVSGDTNGDSKLDVNEIWNYRCTTTLQQTTSNTVTATGMANGLTAKSTADATVVVGSPLVPPLIDLVKVPVPLFLPAGGGSVKYTYLVTNPGTVSLNNVTVLDDKCAQVLGPNGDSNVNGKLDVGEVWTYTCVQNLKATTTNTGTAKGDANGFTVTHSSTVTVVVNAAIVVPKLPNTGFDSRDTMINFAFAFAGMLAVGSLLYVFTQRKHLS